MIIPGIRYKWLEGSSSGRNGYTSGGTEIILQNITRDRSFVLAGVGTEYHVTRSPEVYANFSQAYCPIVGSSASKGFEGYVEFNPLEHSEKASMQI